MDNVSTTEKNAKIAAAAPRSHAKSTWLSKAFPVSELVFRKRKYTIIISETPTVAKANMEWIRNQLKYNRKLREDFGPLLSPKDQSNIVDNGEEFIAWHDDGHGGKRQLAIMQAASTGQALRGRNWNGTRPDLILCDDLEDARPGGNASTPEQRLKLRDWMAQTVMALGDPKGVKTAFVVMGTTVHRESLLMHVLYGRSDYKSTVYRAIINEPKRMDLWEQCRLIYINRDNSKRADDARQFYADNREDMDEGVEVLWQEFQPIWKLMTWKWDNGSKAFNTEYMNNPVDPDSMIFNPETFTYYHGEIDYLSGRYDVSMGVDPAMGKQRGDFSAIVTTAKDRETGIIYVIDAYGERIKPSDFIKVIVEKVLKYQPTVVAAEAVAAQEFIVDELKKALEAVGYPAGTRVKKIYHRSRKELRIEALLPQIENGTIQYNRRHSLLLEQYEMYGTGSHDDVIDAAEMSVSALLGQAASVTTVRRASRW
ncbi:phage terminase large subunit [Sporosarcina sp. E16_3]|nr:phage terminase large subunit [Sporosarcina sp. E16_3]